MSGSKREPSKNIPTKPFELFKPIFKSLKPLEPLAVFFTIVGRIIEYAPARVTCQK
jgi:hypothetical protein